LGRWKQFQRFSLHLRFRKFAHLLERNFSRELLDRLLISLTQKSHHFWLVKFYSRVVPCVFWISGRHFFYQHINIPIWSRRYFSHLCIRNENCLLFDLMWIVKTLCILFHPGSKFFPKESLLQMVQGVLIILELQWRCFFLWRKQYFILKWLKLKFWFHNIPRYSGRKQHFWNHQYFHIGHKQCWNLHFQVRWI